MATIGRSLMSSALAAAVRTALSPLDRLPVHLEHAVLALANVSDPQPGKPEGSGKFVRHPPSLPLRVLDHREA